VPGHWEGDLLIGKDGRSAIATLVERATRYVMLARVPNQQADTVRKAIMAQITKLPAHLRRSLTWDQGREMAQHLRFSVDTGVRVYFCDPHSPWQRGSNENTNGLLRQYFPKGTALSRHTQEHLDAVAAQLNGRPRQTLGWMKPSEKLAELLASTG
jgi:IS30 family transposase